MAALRENRHGASACDGTGVGGPDTGKKVRERCFASTALADDGRMLAGKDSEREILQDGMAGIIAERKTVDGKQGRCAGRCVQPG